MAEAVTKLVLPYFLIWCCTVEQLNNWTVSQLRKDIIEQLHTVLERVNMIMSLNLLWMVEMATKLVPSFQTHYCKRRFKNARCMCECFTFFLLHTDCSKSHTTNLGGGIFAVPWLSSISVALNSSFAKICLLVVPNTWNFDTLRLLASPEFWALVTEYFTCFPEG